MVGAGVQTKLELLRSLLADGNREKYLGMGPGPLRYNLMANQYEVGARKLELEEFNLLDMRVMAGRQVFRVFGKNSDPNYNDMRVAIESEARKNSYHPVEEWLTGLKWDGADRFTSDLPRAFGHDPGTIEAVFLRKTLLAMARRATKAGERVHTILVLVGGQEKNKSTACATLAGRGWFSDDSLDIENKDSWSTCHRHWLVEFAELSALAKRDLEAVKSFITRATDTFRRPFARTEEVLPRRFVCVATTNEEGFLRDTTGNRRFWPVRISSEIDVGYLASNRSQLFAQAIAEVMMDEQHWLTPEEKVRHAALAMEFMASDPWDGPVAAWMAEHAGFGIESEKPGDEEDGVRADFVIQEVFGQLAVEKRTPHDVHRVTAALVKSGARRGNGRKRKRWFWGKVPVPAIVTACAVTENDD